MLIRDLDHVDEIRRANVDVVTFDGMQRSGKGALVGGFYKETVRSFSKFQNFKISYFEMA